MKPLHVSVVILLVLAAAFPLSAQTSDETLAMKFYPSALDANFRAINARDTAIYRTTTVLRVDLDRSHEYAYLAVAYSNGFASTLRILKGKGAEDATLIAESQDVTMGGHGKPVLEAIDVDGDGVPELAVEFQRASWLYKFADGALRLFGPTRQGAVGLTSRLGEVAFVDIDGDGAIELLELGTREEPENRLYKLAANGEFSRVATVAFVDRFTQTADTMEQATRTFEAKPGHYVLRVLNGDARSEHKVAGGEVRVNGVVVAHLFAGIPAARTLRIPVDLDTRNTVTVDLAGEPDAEVTLSILDEK